MRLNLQKKAGLGLVLLVVVGVVGLPAVKWIDATLAKREWKAHRETWEAKGEKFDSVAFPDPAAVADSSSEIIPLFQPPDDGSGEDSRASAMFYSFFEHPLQGLDEDGWFIAMPTPLVSAFELEEDLTLNEEEAAMLLLEELGFIGADLNSFVEAIESGDAALFGTAEQWREVGALSVLVRLSDLLQLRAMTSLRLGKMSEAQRDVVAIVQTAKLRVALATDENLEVPFAIAIANEAWQPVWEGLRNQQWSAQQLQAIIDACEGVDFGAAYVSGLRRDRALTCEKFLAPLADVEQVPFLKRAFESTGFMYRNATNLSTALQTSLFSESDALTDGLTSAQVERIEAATQQMAEQNGRGTVLAYEYLGLIVAEFPRRVFQAELNRRMAITALRVEQHRQEHGDWPASLNEISGAPLPRDPDHPDEPLGYGIDFASDSPVISAGEDEDGVMATWRYVPDE